jgi:DNA invertase Pin-like site-specific DNA recombinase
MLIGHARVSTSDQTLDLQLDALADACFQKVFTDTISDGDTLVVWKLDRPGRS